MSQMLQHQPTRRGVARLVDGLSHLAAGRMHEPKYEREPVPSPESGTAKLLAITNVNIVDVNLGELREEQILVVKGERIHSLVKQDELEALKREQSVRVVDGRGCYLTPGLSDIHCHMSLVSEFEMGLRQLHYFDAQRQRNCEEALKSGCTFVRDSGGSHAIVSWLKSEIDEGRLLGPRILPSYEVLTPRGGMWDVGKVGNAMAPAIFGGKMLNFVSTDDEIKRTLERLAAMGAASFKTYFEERPLYGGTPEQSYSMYTPAQARLLRELADKHGKVLEAHSMFTKGSRLVAEAGFDSIAHLTVDAPYDQALARRMAENGTAIVPTLSVGCYLAQDCGPHGNPDHPDYRFFREHLDGVVSEQIQRCTVPELRSSYRHFQEWILKTLPERSMPMVGQVYPERIHGFMVHAGQSFANLREAGVKIGVGTDGGTGITFAGQLDLEIEAFSHYGFSPAEILRMATLGNMEILHQDNEFGSIEPGKYADFLLLDANPLSDARNLHSVQRVFKGGVRLV